ncbi:MAG: hypothetical protein H8E66_25660 [Planctomycetes bacterium]|nr:hypothetical protein [Planctomycetota bacterium]
MKTSNLVPSARQVLTLAITGVGTLMLAGAIGCNSDSSIPEGAPAAAPDPMEATTDLGTGEGGAADSGEAPVTEEAAAPE